MAFISTSETIEDLGHSAFYNRSDLGLLGGEQLILKPNPNYGIPIKNTEETTNILSDLLNKGLRVKNSNPMFEIKLWLFKTWSINFLKKSKLLTHFFFSFCLVGIEGNSKGFIKVK